VTLSGSGPLAARRGFAPRAVGLDQFLSLVQESTTLLGAAPLRLCGLFLLVYLPVQLIPGMPYMAMPLRAALGSIGLAGFFLALEAARVGRTPTLPDMLSGFRLPAGKLALLAAAGIVPLLCVLAVWRADLGWGEFDIILSGRIPGQMPAERQQVQFVLVYNLLSMPLLFLQPLCVVFAWTATRTLSGSLLVWLANWRWALLLTLALIPISFGIDEFDTTSGAQVFLALAGEVAVEVVLSAFTLVLLARALD